MKAGEGSPNYGIFLGLVQEVPEEEDTPTGTELQILSNLELVVLCIRGQGFSRRDLVTATLRGTHGVPRRKISLTISNQ